MKAALDSRYHFNRVLNNEIPPGDREKAATMGFDPSMVAIKTYGLWSSIMAHLVERYFRQAMEEAEKSGKDLERAKARVAELQVDVKKYMEKKSMLEGKISTTSRDAKNSSTRVKELEHELEATTKKLGEALQKLDKVQSIPPSELYETLHASYEKLKMDALSSFDSGLHTEVAQFEVLHPRLDLLGMGINKIVVGGRLFDVPDEAEEIQKEFEKHVEVPFSFVYAPYGDVAADQVEVPSAANDVIAGEDAGVGVLNAEAISQTVVMDSLDSEATQ